MRRRCWDPLPTAAWVGQGRAGWSRTFPHGCPGLTGLCVRHIHKHFPQNADLFPPPGPEKHSAAPFPTPMKNSGQHLAAGFIWSRCRGSSGRSRRGQVGGAATTDLGRSYSDQSLQAEQQSLGSCMAFRDTEALVKCHKPGTWYPSYLAWQSTGSLGLGVSICKMGYSVNLWGTGCDCEVV